jgi:hypothetical protein
MEDTYFSGDKTPEPTKSGRFVARREKQKRTGKG